MEAKERITPTKRQIRTKTNEDRHIFGTMPEANQALDISRLVEL